MKLFPQTTDFFELFEQQANLLQKAVGILSDLEESDNAKKQAIRLKKLEHEADNIIHEIMNKLNTCFITPIDREDIAKLASDLDDIIDVMDMAVARIDIYKIDPIPKEAFLYIHIAEKAIKQVIAAVRELGKNKNQSKLLKHCEFVNFVENEADDLHRHTLRELFTKETDPLQIIKIKELYEILEHITDRCEDAANTIETIVVKNQ